RTGTRILTGGRLSGHRQSAEALDLDELLRWHSVGLLWRRRRRSGRAIACRVVWLGARGGPCRPWQAARGEHAALDHEARRPGNQARLLAVEVVARVVHRLQANGGDGRKQLALERGLGDGFAEVQVRAKGAEVRGGEATAPPRNPRRALLALRHI